MRVLHCLAQLPTRTGSGVYFHNLINEINKQTDWQQAALYALPANSFDQTSLQVELSQCSQDEIAEWIDCDSHYPVFFETEDIPFPIVGMSDEMPYPSTRYCRMDEEMINCWESSFYKELIRIKENYNPDVIISHHLWVLTAMVLEVFPDIPVIGISHGTDIRQARQNPEIAGRAVGSLRRLDRVLALADSHIEDLKECFDLLPEQIIVTGGAFDNKMFYPATHRPGSYNENFVTFLYAGKMSHAKGVYELVAAFADLYKKNPAIRLDLVGTADAEMKALLNSDNVPSQAIRLFDVESQAELAEHLRHSDVFVLASYYEGLGLIAIEALASGVALVSNNLPALSQQLAPSLEDTDLISWVELPRLRNLDEPYAEDIPAYVSRLSAAMEEQARRTLRTNGERENLSQSVQVFSWESLAAKLVQIVKDLS
ncbi:MAG: glycosyltransferase family 4 protein [Eubacteriales bacterium]|nr:glycosyltransferase family 4 protein [Eubacteriales bacterium]MDD4541763.1 glycosyltransferase family 4 protein [Eubacteriales bacterium]